MCERGSDGNKENMCASAEVMEIGVNQVTRDKEMNMCASAEVME